MKKTSKIVSFMVVFVTAITTLCTTSFAAVAKQINLSEWKSVELTSDNSTAYANWKFNDTKTSVTQTINARASALISDIECNNNKIDGTFSVDTRDDDDFIGFVFGYKDVNHYYLFDWKENQGMSVKLINTDDSIKESELWSTSGSGDKVKILYQNTISYVDETVYNFALTFTDKGTFNIIIKQGDKVLDNITINDNTYTSGKFGFYNCSQAMVTYSGFTMETLGPVLQVTSSEDKTEIGLSWNPVDGAASYIIKRSTTPGGPYTPIAAGLTGTAYTDPYVTNGTTYYYVVTAIVGGGDNLNSKEASITPAASTAGNQALLVITMENGERKEYDLSMEKINDFMIWYNNNPTSSSTYAIEKNYNRASFTSRKDYISYEQISSVEVDEYNY